MTTIPGYANINNHQQTKETIYMARHSTKRPRELALEVFKLNKAVTPSEIDKHVGGEYSSKYICQLRKRGFEFEVSKDGRNVVSYTLIKEPKNAEEIRTGTKKQKAPKVTKAPKAPVAKKTASVKAPVTKAPKAKVSVTKTTVPLSDDSTKAIKTWKDSNLAKIKAVAEQRKAIPKATPVSSVVVDEDFDAIEDVRALV